MDDKKVTLKLMRELLIACLKFIESSKDKYPLPTGNYVDVRVDYLRKQWITFTTNVVNLNGWAKKEEMLNLPEVYKALDHLYGLEIMRASDTNNRGQLSTKNDKNEKLDRLRNFEISFFISAYINKYDLSFNDSKFNYIFSVWFNHLQMPNSSKRICVLRNFFLEGLESIDILGYKIRRLKNYEIRLLLGMGAYAGNVPQYRFWNLPSDLKKDLNPMYCVEVPPLIFDADNEEISSEYIKYKLLGLLLTFKDGIISMDTELNYDPMEEFKISYGSSGIFSWNELHTYFRTTYILSNDETDKLYGYEAIYKKINLKKSWSLRLAIRRFLGASWRSYWDDIIIDYMIALESLLSNSDQEIKYKISLRAAYLLNENPSDRPRTFEIMKVFYDLRSKIVHGSLKDLESALKRLKPYFPENITSPEATFREYTRIIIQKYVSLISDSNGDEKKHFLELLDNKILGSNNTIATKRE